MDSSITAFKVRAQLAGFLGIFSTRFSKPIQRFIGQMLFGIQAAQDVKLSQIGRELQEPIRIGKVENRLSRNLAHEGMAEKLHACILDHAAPSIHQDTLIIIDSTDIQKQYARKMDYLAKVRDGSKGELGENLGYNGCMAVACESGARQMSPLVLRLWSSEAPDFQSENTEVEAVVDSIAKRTKGRGIYVYDRGGDRIGFFEHLLEANLRFIVRLVGNRKLVWRKNTTLLAEKLAAKCHMSHASNVTFLSHGCERSVPIQFGVLEVSLPDRPGTDLRLVVVRGFGEKPMLLLTNLKGTKSFKNLWQVVEGYITRWRVEETIRYIKQSYRLEDMRVLSYERFKNMAALVLCTAHFAASWMGFGERHKILTSHVVDLSQRINKTPEFYYYAVADGIRRLFTRFGQGWRRDREKPPDPIENRQMLLPLGFLQE